MSFASTLAKGFKNFGHAIATAGKYIATGVKDVVMVANKAQAIAPELEALAGALAGPLGAKVTDTAMHLLGDVANHLMTLGVDAGAVGATTGLNLTLDTALINDIKALIPALAGVVESVGGKVPPPQVIEGQVLSVKTT